MGLRVVFNKALQLVENGVSPGGAAFPNNIFNHLNLDKNELVLDCDYLALNELGSAYIIFLSVAPNRVQMTVHKKIIQNIFKDDELIFPFPCVCDGRK